MRIGVDQPVVVYHQPVGETAEILALMRLADAQFLETPWYGTRQMAWDLRWNGHEVGRKRVRRLMTRVGLAPIYQRLRTTVPHPEHRIYPYLLRDLVVNRPNQVWCASITYIPVRLDVLYLVAVMDWSMRKVLAWRVSNMIDVAFCVEALTEALARFGRPEIFSTDQGGAPHGFACVSRWNGSGGRVWCMDPGAAMNRMLQLGRPKYVRLP